MHKQHFYSVFCVVLKFNIYVLILLSYVHIQRIQCNYSYKNKNLYIPKTTNFEYIQLFARISSAIFVLSNVTSGVVFFFRGFDRSLWAVFRSSTILRYYKKNRTHPTGSSSHLDIGSGFSMTASLRGRMLRLPPVSHKHTLRKYSTRGEGATTTTKRSVRNYR